MKYCVRLPGGAALLAAATLVHAEPLGAVARQGWAVAATLGYAAFCAAIWLRHRRQRLAAERAAAALLQGDSGGEPLLIAFASQTGSAERIAWQSADALRAGGVPVRLLPLAQLDAATLAATPRALFVVSTYGEGDPPDAAAAFARRTMSGSADLHGLRFGLLALGDSGYAEFCGFGRALTHWLRGHGAHALFDPVEVDNNDPAMLRHWQHQLGLLGADTQTPDWNPPDYGRWRLRERHHLNPGNPDHPAFLISLEPPAGTVDWQAGDIAEIGPRQDTAVVAALLERLGMDGTESVAQHGERQPLSGWLAVALLPQDDAGVEALRGQPASALAALPALPHREYSIASLPASGRLELLVRLQRHPDGRPGLGSGYLALTAAIGDEIALRVRSNRHFHAPPPEPLILIGNGTGIAGLRAHLQARAAAGLRRNWLLFGERSAAHDFFFADEIRAWLDDGTLERLDLAFSRDQPERRYVQHALREAAATLRDWIADGAAIYVCGSLDGMAPAVEAVLVETLGEEVLEMLAETGRYRRDVY